MGVFPCWRTRCSITLGQMTLTGQRLRQPPARRVAKAKRPAGVGYARVANRVRAITEIFSKYAAYVYWIYIHQISTEILADNKR